jgi:hypothetical protein
MLTRAAYVPEMGVGEARAFRLDEILEALIAVGPLRVHGGSDGWYVYLCDEADEHRSAMPVEAAAACYLAVLRAAREARP